jgi:hypothetical protein
MYALHPNNLVVVVTVHSRSSDYLVPVYGRPHIEYEDDLTALLFNGF